MLDVLFWGLKASPVALTTDVHCGCLEINALQFLIKKIPFFSCKVLVIKTLDLDTKPDPHWPKMLDPDPHWNQCGSETLEHTDALFYLPKFCKCNRSTSTYLDPDRRTRLEGGGWIGWRNRDPRWTKCHETRKNWHDFFMFLRAPWGLELGHPIWKFFKPVPVSFLFCQILDVWVRMQRHFCLNTDVDSLNLKVKHCLPSTTYRYSASRYRIYRYRKYLSAASCRATLTLLRLKIWISQQQYWQKPILLIRLESNTTQEAKKAPVQKTD